MTLQLKVALSFSIADLRAQTSATAIGAAIPVRRRRMSRRLCVWRPEVCNADRTPVDQVSPQFNHCAVRLLIERHVHAAELLRVAAIAIVAVDLNAVHPSISNEEL